MNVCLCACVCLWDKNKKIKKGNKRTINDTLLSVSYLQLNGEHAVCAPSWNIDINAFFPSWIGHVWPLKLCWQPRKGCGRSPRKVTLVPFCANSKAAKQRCLGPVWIWKSGTYCCDKTDSHRSFGFQKTAGRNKVYFGVTDASLRKFAFFL